MVVCLPEGMLEFCISILLAVVGMPTSLLGCTMAKPMFGSEACKLKMGDNRRNCDRAIYPLHGL